MKGITKMEKIIKVYIEFDEKVKPDETWESEVGKWLQVTVELGASDCLPRGVIYASLGSFVEGKDLKTVMLRYLEESIREYREDEDYKAEIIKTAKDKTDEELARKIFEALDKPLAKLIECELRRELLGVEP